MEPAAEAEAEPGAAGLVIGPPPPTPTPTASTSTATPFENDLVFKMIMEYVGTDRASLLASRLVSHLWSGKAMEILRQEKSSVLSIGSDREAYWKERDPECRTPSDSLEYLLSCENVDDTMLLLEKAVDQIELKLCTRDVDSEETSKLIQVLPANPQMNITAIEFDGGYYPAIDAAFWRLVEECAVGLKTLKFNVKFDLEGLEREDELASATPDFATTFLSLNNIWISTPSGVVDQRFYQIPLEIAGQAPNLTSLRVHSGTADSLMDRKSVISLMASRLLSTTTFHELALPLPIALPFGLPNGYREITQRFSKLGVLNLMVDALPVNFLLAHFVEYITEFLESSAVTSVELNWTFQGALFLQPLPNQIVVGHLPRPIVIPSLPNLMHLGMSSICSPTASTSTTGHAGPCCVWYTCDFLRAAASQWTGIKSFSISQCLLIKLVSDSYLSFMRECRPELGLWYLQFNFPSVTTLVLTHPTQCGSADSTSSRIKDVDNDQLPDLPIMITSLFPNLQEIVIDLRDCDEAAWNVLETKVLPGILRVGGIRRLDFENYYTNALGNFQVDIQGSPLSESKPDKIVYAYTVGDSGPTEKSSKSIEKILNTIILIAVTDLEHLELKLGKNDHRGFADFILPTDLGVILNLLPNIKVFRVDPRLMASTSGGGDFSTILEEVRPIREQFPGVDIKIM